MACFLFIKDTGVAQLVEHWSPKPGVGRSSRSSRANPMFAHTVMKIKAYIEEAYKELVHKVTWPTWRELQDSALIVMVASLIFAVIVFVMDFSFQKIMHFIYQMII